MMKKENISKFVGEHKWKIVGGVVTVAAFVGGVGAGYGYCCKRNVVPPDVIGRPGQRIEVLESGEEFQSARECARNIEGDHKSVLRAARNNREYKERHFKLIT